jgi:predicted Holliday junction resolvase-like endonuclease
MLFLLAFAVLMTIALLALAVVHARYKATHPHTEQALKSAREKAAKASRATSRGHAADHLAPYLPDFAYHPSDCRFLGSPIDHVIFDGLHERGIVERIVFLEIKTQQSKLKKSQLAVRRALEEGRVEFDTYRPRARSSGWPQR